MIYILIMDNPTAPGNTTIPTRVRLIGPFPDGATASFWIVAPVNNPDDNPCWQIVDLDRPVVDVVAP